MVFKIYKSTKVKQRGGNGEIRCKHSSPVTVTVSQSFLHNSAQRLHMLRSRDFFRHQDWPNPLMSYFNCHSITSYFLPGMMLFKFLFVNKSSYEGDLLVMAISSNLIGRKLTNATPLFVRISSQLYQSKQKYVSLPGLYSDALYLAYILLKCSLK